MIRRWTSVVLLVAVSCAAAARTGSAQDTEAKPEYFTPSWLGRWHLSPYGDLRLRHDRVIDRPGATEDLQRIRGRLRTGLVWSPHPRLGFEAGGYWGMWKAEDSGLAEPFDNERDDSLAVDRLAVMWAPGTMVTLALGKRPLPLTTTEMTWDPDLRPIGTTLVARREFGEFDEMRIAAAGVGRSEEHGNDVMLAGQIAYAYRPGAAHSAELLAGIADYSNLDGLARAGLGRQNRLVATPDGPAFATDFTVLELQAAGRTTLGPLPWTVALHGVRNLDADTENHGFRGSSRFGDLGSGLHTELGYVFQVIERDALPGAFNSDDWWFHTRASGHRAWLAVRPLRWATARVSMFDERRDDIAKRTRRWHVDLELELPRE